MKQAGIYVNDVFCGILTEDEEGFHFIKLFLSEPIGLGIGIHIYCK